MADDIKVSYRLGEPYSSLLAKEARERLMSPHQYARLLLVNHFERSEALDVKDDLRAVVRAVESLRMDFNEALE